MRWRVQGNDRVTAQQLIDGLMIEMGTVVALEHERGAMPQEQLVHAKGHGFSQGPISH
jgi:hypothetical protein